MSISAQNINLPLQSVVKKRFFEISNHPVSDEAKSALRLPSFDSYEWDDVELLHLMQTMFTELGLLDTFNIPLVTLNEWIFQIYTHYRALPYHNFHHSFCVTQIVYAMICHVDLINRIGDLQALILLVSSICHDLDHPGLDNSYQVNARTELAQQYNNISPLENHHCSMTFQLLENPEYNIFSSFSTESLREIHDDITTYILATDKERHYEIFDQFKQIIPIFNYTNSEHIKLLCMVLIKVADLSNVVRPSNVAEPWLLRLFEECMAQRKLEVSEGLPITPCFDPDVKKLPMNQIRFIELIVIPLCEAVGELLNGLQDFIIVPLKNTLNYYYKKHLQTNPQKLNPTTESSSKINSSSISRFQHGGGKPVVVTKVDIIEKTLNSKVNNFKPGKVIEKKREILMRDEYVFKSSEGFTKFFEKKYSAPLDSKFQTKICIFVNHETK